MVELEKRVGSLERRLSEIEKVLKDRATPEPGGHKRISLGEFVRERFPRSDPEAALLIGCYLQHYDDMASFNREDLEVGFRRIKRPRPVNTDMAINRNIQKGHMDETGTRKGDFRGLTVTAAGERFVGEMEGRER